MSVLVTGGAGFIGSHLADRLLADGLDVTVLDNLDDRRPGTRPAEATFVEGDVGERVVVDEVFATSASTRCSTSRVRRASALVRRPEVDLATNVLGTVNVLRGCLESGVPRLVHASSMTVYGEPERIPTPEDVAVRTGLVLRRDEVRGRALRTDRR